MLKGKVKDALKLVNGSADICGLHNMSDAIKAVLQEKHPKAERPSDDVLDSDEIPRVETVVFEMIDGSVVQQAAKHTKGSGGPTKVTPDTWKNLLCGHGKLSDELADQVAILIRRIESIRKRFPTRIWISFGHVGWSC